MNIIKTEINKIFDLYSSIEPINDLGDYYKAGRWMKKTLTMYAIFSAIALLIIPFVTGMAFSSNLPIFIPVLIPCMILLTCWGYASLLLHLKQVIKSIVKSGSEGYKVGEKIETTHYEVSHEFGNTYKVSSHTENKGCLFAVIAMVCRLFIWAFFCVYISPFITFKKIQKTKKAMMEYKSQTVSN